MAKTPPDDRSKRFLFDGSELNRFEPRDSRRHRGYQVLPTGSPGRTSSRQKSPRQTGRRRTEYEPTPGLFSGGRPRQSGGSGRYIGVALMAGAAAVLVAWLFLSIGRPDGTVVGGVIPALDGSAAGEPGGNAATFASPEDAEDVSTRASSVGAAPSSRDVSDGAGGVPPTGATTVAGSVGEGAVASAEEAAPVEGGDPSESSVVGPDGERPRLTIEVFSRPPPEAARDTTPAGSF